jgi:hypothetical protein
LDKLLIRSFLITGCVFLASSVFILSCHSNQTVKTNSTSVDSSKIQNEDHQTNLKQERTIDSNITWTDSLIRNYIANTDNELISSSRKQNINEQWILDTQSRNNRIYFVAEIGHDFEYKFVPEAWIYIDTLTKALFEYNVENDTLIKWKPKRY